MAVPSFTPRPEQYTYPELVLNYFGEKFKDVSKWINYSTFWAGKAVPNLPPQVASLGSVMGDFKNFMSAGEVPKKAVEALVACKGFFSAVLAWDKVTEAARGVLKKSTALMNAVTDGVDFSSRFILIDSKTMSTLKGVNSVATLAGSGHGAFEQLEKINEHSGDTTRITLYVINFFTNLSFAAVGVMGIFAWSTATVVAPWMIVSALTAGLTFSTLSFFYEKIYDPEGLGKNLNPETVIKNNMDRQRLGLI